MVDRELYKKSFTHKNTPNWKCPTCDSSIGVLEDKFLFGHTASTTAYIKEDWFDPIDMAKLTYTAFFQCSNPKCLEIVISSGTGSIDQQYNDYDSGWSYIEYFKPKFFYPPLHIFKLPKDTPEDVLESIISSFSFVFINQSAAANQIRIALECLLTHLKVNRFIVTKNKKRKRLNLHKRIELLPTRYQKIKEVCLAIKWLGNAGSHCDDKMSFDDVFDGYDMLSFILEELYDNKHEHVVKIAKSINDKKGI